MVLGELWKVGDTISATIEPADATNVTYAWYMGDAATQVETAIADATTSSLKITDAMVGKYIKVVASGEEGSSQSATTTAKVEAAATDKIAIASAKQIGAAKIEVTFNKPVSTSGWDITVSRGTTAQTITTVLDDAATTATITLGTAISTAEYTVKVVNKTDATENAEAKVSGEQAVLKSIGFVGKELVLTDSLLQNAAVTVQGLNQFEEKVALSGALTTYTTKGTATYDQASGKIKISCTGTTFFQVGEQVTVTAVYNQGSGILQVAEPLTVSNVATLSKFELGDLASTRASLKGKRIDLTNLATDTYYFPVKVAEDQYGNKLSAKELDDMMVKGAATTAKNLYITPNAKEGSYAYVTGFTALDDGTIAMNVSKGDLNSPGKAVFTITGVSGFSGTQDLEIVDDPFINELTVSAPTLYANKEAELTVTAKDQYGDAIDLYNFIGTKNVGVTGASGVGTFANTFVFDDINHQTKGATSLKFNGTGDTIKVATNTSKKTVTFTFTPATKGQDIVTVQTATPTVSNLNWTVAATPGPAGISGLKSGVATTFVTGTGKSSDLSANTNIVFLDDSGAAIDITKVDTTDKTKYPKFVTSAPAAGDAVGFYYTVEETNTSGGAVSLANGVVTENTTTGTENITVKLYGVTATTSSTQVSALAEKVIKFTTAGALYTSYKASLAAGSELLYVNASSADTSAFSVVGVDANGLEVPVTAYTVTVDSDLKVSGQKVSGAVSGISAKGTAVATIWASINGDPNSAVATVDVPYDVAAPAAQKVSTTDNKDEFTGVTALTINADGSATVVNATKEYTLQIVDQYGLPMKNTTWALGGVKVTSANAANLGTAKALTATSAKVSGSWTIEGNPVKIVGVDEAAASDGATVCKTSKELEAALGKAKQDQAANKITVAADITLEAAVEVAAGDTLVIEAGNTLKQDTSKTITNNGTIDIYGTLDEHGKVLENNNVIKVEKAGTFIADKTGDSVTSTASNSIINNEGTVTWSQMNNTYTTFNGSGSYTVDTISGATVTTDNKNIFAQAIVLPAVTKIVLSGNITLPANTALDEGTATPVAAKRIHRFTALEIALEGNTLDLGNAALMFNGVAATAYKITSSSAGGKVTSSAYYTIGIQLPSAAQATNPEATKDKVTIANTNEGAKSAALLIWDDAMSSAADNGIDLANFKATLSSENGYKIRIECDSAAATTLTWTAAGTPATGQGKIGVNGTTGDQFVLPAGMAETSVGFQVGAPIASFATGTGAGAETGALTALATGVASDALTATNDVLILIK